MKKDCEEILVNISDSNRIIKHWDSLGLLTDISENKIRYISNTLELTLAYLMRLNTQNSVLVTIIFPIIRRIGAEFEFGINDLFEIINEVRIGVSELKSIDDIDVEADFCANYANNKIIELQNKNK